VSEQVADGVTSLLDELGQVEQEVRVALDDLRAPFSQLVQSQLRAGYPLLRGAFVLTAGAGAVDSPLLLQQRRYLGAAIEMLRLALAIHTRLLALSEPQAQLERSLLGSTVLAGDFCFSRSAGLAAKTNSPAVVDIFAEALQRVSEGTLRGLFNPTEANFDIERELCLAGVAAADELAGLGEQERQVDRQLATRLLDSRQAGALQKLALPPALTDVLAVQRAARWQALLDWLHAC
jgi:octaprenyl-diphosphate synthase